MADVAGSVVGIVSLGIQVAQGLLSYYGAWKDYDNDILEICQSLDSLLQTLEILSNAIRKPTWSETTAKNNVESSIIGIYGIVVKLNAKLDKVKSTKAPTQNVRLLTRRHVRRALYPFKEPTLRKIQEAVSDARANLTTALEVLNVSLTTDIRHTLDSFVRQQGDEETQKVLEWLSPVNFWLKQADVSNQRTRGTGEWLLKHADFLGWAEGNTDTVWCLGGPGVGKTVLSSAVVEFLEKDLPTRDFGLAFVYCEHKEYLSQRVEYFVGAIIRQLVERLPVIPQVVQHLYESHKRKGTKPTRREYFDLLQSLSKNYSEVYMVIDALDECIDQSGTVIWKELLTTLRTFVANLRLLYTSRHIHGIEATSSGSTCIEIRARDEDMKNYIQAQVERRSVLSKFCADDKSLQDEIMQVVVTRADGMFLAAKLCIDSLSDRPNLRAVKRALNAMPRSLDETYDQAMERIKIHQYTSYALLALTWIVFAVRPLQVLEVQHALAVDELEPEDRSVATDMLVPSGFIVDACAGLVKINKKGNVFGLVHKTTQEYFERKGEYHFPNAQWDIGRVCLTYLSLDVFSEGPCATDRLLDSRIADNILVNYAAKHLSSHIHGETANRLKDLALKFFRDNTKVSSASQILFVPGRSSYFTQRCENYPRGFFGLHYAACFGLTEVANSIIEKSAAVDSKDGYDLTPLFWAAEQGQQAVLQLLLEAKADVETKNKYGRTPLSSAAKKGYEVVVRLLLEAKADIETRDENSQTPLSLAAEQGREAVIQLLLDANADVETKDRYGRAPLSLAAEQGHKAVVQLLLEANADVETKDEDGQTPLSLATAVDSKDVVQLLLDAKADIETKDRYGRTPLIWAAGEGQQATLQLLLKANADIETKDIYGRTPLSLAAEQGHEAVVQLLLKNNADIETKDIHGRTPLSSAAAVGSEAVVRLLLEAKAKIKRKDKYGRTPLSLASDNGHEAVVKLLQSKITLPPSKSTAFCPPP